MKLDKLELNSDKTEIILVGTRPQLDKIRFDHLKVDDIGAWFDCNLTLPTHSNIRFARQFITIFITSDKYENF